jgi:hypothetical protein
LAGLDLSDLGRLRVKAQIIKPTTLESTNVVCVSDSAGDGVCGSVSFDVEKILSVDENEVKAFICEMYLSDSIIP